MSNALEGLPVHVVMGFVRLHALGEVTGAIHVMIPRMGDSSDNWDGEFRVGDRVEWVGPSLAPFGGPDHGEGGWIVDIHPMDDCIQWDSTTDTGNYFHPPNAEEIRFVRREPDPTKRFRLGDPDAPEP